MRGGRFELAQDLVQYIIGALQGVVVPETDDTQTLRFQYFSPAFVVRDLFKMLAAVQFDYQTAFETDEIDDKAFDLVLPTELRTELVVAKSRP